MCFQKFYCPIIFLGCVFYELKTMILHLQWNLSVIRNTLQQHGRGLTWCIGYLRTSFYSMELLLLCLREGKRVSESATEPWAKLICLSGTVSIVLFVLFFLPGYGLQERLKSQMHGHFVWGAWQKRKTKFTNLREKNKTKPTFNSSFIYLFLSLFLEPLFC